MPEAFSTVRSASEHAPTGGAYLRLIVLAAAIGIPAALLAAAFLASVHYVQGWLWDDLPDALGYSSPPLFLVVGLPVVGALIVLIARVFLPGDGGHSPLEGLRSESTPVVNGPGIALAAVGTLGFGAVLGPELPVIALGSIVGVAVTRFVRLDSRGTAVLSSAGSFSAVSALFGGPLVAGILLVEAGVAMGAGLVPALLPGFVAAAVGYLIFVGLGDWGGLDAPASSCPTWPRTRERICTTSASPSSSAWPQQSSSRRCTSSEFESTAFAGGWGWPCSSSAAVSRSA